MLEKHSFRLDKFYKLPYKTKKNLICHPQGRRVYFLFLTSLSPCDLIRIIDQSWDIFLLEVIDPLKKLVYLRQFPPVSEMNDWKERKNWGTCEISNYIGQEEDCGFYSNGILQRINKPQIIRILEERGRRLSDF